MAQPALQSQLKRAVRIESFIQNTKDKVAASKQTFEYYQTRISLLEKYWDSFESGHFDLLDYESDLEQSPYFKEDSYSAVEAIYLSALAELKANVALLTPRVQIEQLFDNQDDNSATIRLPILALPTFSGKQEDWESFKQRFNAILDTQPRLLPVAKLQYLMNSLEGPAALRLKGMAVTGNNFEVAWERLTRRYDNPNIRLHSNIENLIGLPAMRKHTVADLTTLVDRAEENVRALIALNWPIEHSHPFLIHCITRKLDVLIRDDWNLARELDPANHSTYNHLITFLEKRIQSLEQTSSSAN